MREMSITANNVTLLMRKCVSVLSVSLYNVCNMDVIVVALFNNGVIIFHVFIVVSQLVFKCSGLLQPVEGAAICDQSYRSLEGCHVSFMFLLTCCIRHFHFLFYFERVCCGFTSASCLSFRSHVFSYL